LSPLRGRPSRVTLTVASVESAAGRAVALPLQPLADMPPDSTPPDDAPSPAVVHQFTVLRGMAVAVVIETRDWYLGLIQAAVARVRLEGDN
jgi:hypothetical protein